MAKPDTIVTRCRKNFQTLQRAFKQGDIGLVECQLKATGEPVAVICAFQYDGEEIEFVPFAMMFSGNPYDQLNPPNPEGGFHKD